MAAEGAVGGPSLMTGAVGAGVTGVGTLLSLGEGGWGTEMVVPVGVMMSSLPEAVVLPGASVGGTGTVTVVDSPGAAVVDSPGAAVVEAAVVGDAVVGAMVVPVVGATVVTVEMGTQVTLMGRLLHWALGK